jgi:hypothetical protein
VDELLQQGVIRPRKSPYASPAFLVPKHGGEFRIVVDCRNVNSKVVFDSYPTPTIDQAFEQFDGAVVFGARFELCLLPNTIFGEESPNYAFLYSLWDFRVQ